MGNPWYLPAQAASCVFPEKARLLELIGAPGLVRQVLVRWAALEKLGASAQINSFLPRERAESMGSTHFALSRSGVREGINGIYQRKLWPLLSLSQFNCARPTRTLKTGRT